MKRNETLLMLAGRYGDGAMASALIAAGADINYVEPQFGQDALMIAVRSGRPSVVEALVKAGAELNRQTPPGPEPTVRAPGAGGGSTGEGMIRSGVPPEGQRLAGTGKLTALLYAARDGQLEAARAAHQGRREPGAGRVQRHHPAADGDHQRSLRHGEAADRSRRQRQCRRLVWPPRRCGHAVESRNRDVSSATATSNGVDREAGAAADHPAAGQGRQRERAHANISRRAWAGMRSTCRT